MGFMDSVKGLFGKIKGYFEPSGLKMVVELKSKQMKKADGSFGGKITISAEKDQVLEYLKVKLEEEWSTGRGEDKTTKTFELGQKDISENIEIKAGETKTFDFSCDYSVLKSKNEQMQDGGKVSSALGKIGSFMDAEKSVYRVIVNTNIKGKFNSPDETIDVELV